MIYLLIAIAVAGWASLFLYWLNNRKGAWDVDETMWMRVRDKVLKDRYAGCAYSMMSSNSPVITMHRGPLSLSDRHKIQKFFPKWIRVEFQEVHYKGEQVHLWGRGDLIVREGGIWSEFPIKVQIMPSETKWRDKG